MKGEMKPVGKWLHISLVSLLIVAMLGTLMRYKIGFAFPIFEQKNIQHAHSHFAFGAWISQTIMVLMIHYLQKRNKPESFSNYNLLLWANLLFGYGMLISFFIQGYGAVSIGFSTASVLISFLFTFVFFADLKTIPPSDPSKNWFKSALIFNVFSSLGTFSLAYMMATQQLIQKFYLASIYFYLHFQYNGWFFFAIVGIFIGYLHRVKPELKVPDSIFYLFVVACPMAYFLSTLWAELPFILYLITVLSAVMQTFAWGQFLRFYKRNSSGINACFSPFWRWVFLLVLISFTAKWILQLGSTIPEVSILAFGFRPIVIAYLHLVLLAITSIFLVAFIFSTGLLKTNRTTMAGLSIFIIGVYSNEILLGIQGVASLSYTAVPYANEILFVLGLVMVIGLIVSLFSVKQAE